MSCMPSICVFSKKNAIEHALQCKDDGFVSLRHNELCDLAAEMLSEVCNRVAVKPIISNTPFLSQSFAMSAKI